MNNITLKKVLELDSLLGYLDWYDRASTHLYFLGKINTPTNNVLLVYDWINKNEWISPEQKYTQERLKYWLNPYTKEWEPNELFKSHYPKIDLELKNLLNEH